MNFKNLLIRTLYNIPPKVFVFICYSVAAWFILGSVGELLAVWPEVFSGEVVINIW
jgi:hypothetical protein